MTISVVLSNRWATFHCPPEVQLQLKPYFRYRKPGYRFAPSYQSGEWDGYVCLFSRGRIAAGLFLETRTVLEKDFALRIIDQRQPPPFRNLPYAERVRPYQRQAIEAMVTSAQTGGLILSATGSGKTFMVGEFFRRLQGTACFIVDELTLLEQARQELTTIILEEKVGVVGRSEYRPRRITIATIQTLHLHRNNPDFQYWFRHLDVLVIDEIHLALNRRNLDIVRKIHPKAVYGLTATLEIEKPSVHLQAVALAGPVLFQYPIQEGIQQGYLAQGRIICLGFRDPLLGPAPGYWSMARGERIWIRASSPAAEYRYRVALNRQRNDCIEALVREGLRWKRRVVVLVEHLSHLRTLSRRLTDIPHRVMCGAVSMEERIQAKRDMDQGRVSLILANRVFSKGVDIRTLDMIIDATALPGRNGTLQRYGRGTRKAEGKRNLLYIDIADYGKYFGPASAARRQALKEVGYPIIDWTWERNARELFEKYN